MEKAQQALALLVINTRGLYSALMSVPSDLTNKLSWPGDVLALWLRFWRQGQSIRGRGAISWRDVERTFSYLNSWLIGAPSTPTHIKPCTVGSKQSVISPKAVWRWRLWVVRGSKANADTPGLLNKAVRWKAHCGL